MFAQLAMLVLRRPRRAAMLAFLSTMIAALFAVNLGVKSNLLELMPADHPAVRAVAELDRTEGGITFLTINVTGPEQAQVDAFLADLQPKVAALPQVRYAMWTLDPDVAHRIGVMQIPAEDLTVIRDRLKGAVALGPAAANPFIASRLLDLGPLTEKLKGQMAGFSLGAVPNSGRLLIRPTGSAHDTPFARELMHNVNDAIAAADPAAHGVKIAWLGGPYRHTIEEVDGIEHDLAWTSFASFALISLAIFLAYRDWKALVVIMVPQVVGSIWTLGFATIAVGSVNMFTSFSIAVLVGLGNDYAIIYFSRYREERAAGHSINESIRRAWDACGPPSLTAAATTAVGFLALLVASFQGFQQLGVIIGVGVILCFIAVITLLPLLLKWLDPEPKGGLIPAKIEDPDTSVPPSYPWALPTLVISGFVTLVALVALPYIGFDFDLSQLRRNGLAYEELDEEQRAMARASYAPILVDYTDDKSLRTDYAKVRASIQDGSFPEIAQALSIHTVIPEDAAVRGALLDEIAALARSPGARYLPRAAQANLALLTKLPPGESFALQASDLPEPLLNILGADNGKHRMVLLPAGNMWDIRECEKLAESLHRELPGRHVAGEYLIQGALYKMTLTDGPRIGLVALLAVSLLMWFDLRRFWLTVWGVGVQVAGLLWAGGAMVPLDLQLNLVNLVGIPIAIGTGIEFAIFLMHRLEDEGPWGVKRAVLTSGMASVLCMVTTMLGFVSLSVAQNRGIRSLGILVTAGDFVHAIAGFIILPAGAAYLYHLRGKAQAKASAS